MGEIAVGGQSKACLLFVGLALIPSVARSQVAAVPGRPMKTMNAGQGFNVTWSEDSSKVHTGIDFPAKAGDPVFSMKTGTIEKKGWLGNGTRKGKTINWGYYVVVRNDDGTINGYLHITESKAKEGVTRINAGSPIGNVYSDHLHLNACYQVAGCQHGAYINPTFTDKLTKMTKYYLKPTWK